MAAADPKLAVCRWITEKLATTGDVGHPPAVLARRFPRLAPQLLQLPDRWWHCPPGRINCALTRQMDAHEGKESVEVRAGVRGAGERRWIDARPLCRAPSTLSPRRSPGACPPGRPLPHASLRLPPPPPHTHPPSHTQRRIGEFKRWLLVRPERVFVVVGHSAFFRQFCSGYAGQQPERMRNCEVRVVWV